MKRKILLGSFLLMIAALISIGSTVGDRTGKYGKSH